MNAPVKYLLPLKLFLIVSGLFCITLFTYWGTLQNTFVSDSRASLVGNPYITDLSVDNIAWMFTTLSQLNWHPITWLSFSVDYWIYNGLNPGGFHLTNNILHGINSVLLLFVILIILGLCDATGRSRYPIKLDQSSLMAAFISAVLFAVHPQHVESVAWVAERKDMLCQLFSLATFVFYIGYVVGENKKNKLQWYLISLSMYLLALMSKPMAVTLPVLLLLLDIYPIRRASLLCPVYFSIQSTGYLKLFVEKIPFFIFSALSIILTLEAQTSAISNLSEIPMYFRIVNAFNSVVLYLSKALLPIHFSTYYPHFYFKASSIEISEYVSIAGVILITLMTYILWRQKRYAWLISWLFYLISLSPVIGIIQVGLQGAADRYAYFTTLPLYFLLAAGLYRLLEKRSIKILGIMFLVVTMLIGLLIYGTKQQIKIWRNPITLWQFAVDSYPDNGFAHGNLGSSFYMVGDYIDAVKHFDIAQAKGQMLVDLLVQYGMAAIYIKDFKKAIEVNLMVLANADINQKYVINKDCVQYNMAWSFMNMGMPGEAREILTRISDNSSNASQAHNLAGFIDKLEEQKKDSLSNQMPEICKNPGGYTIK